MKFTQKTLISVLDSLKKKNILVIGDLILDKYTAGQVSRISQEAPVPVLHVQNTAFKLGGAASTALILKHLGMHVTLVGICGQGVNGRQFIKLLQEAGIDADFVIKTSEYTTILKERVIADNQQVIRIDYEKTSEVSNTIQNQLSKIIEDNIKAQDALIISDYNKGLLSKALISNSISASKKQGIPCIVDPAHGKPIEWYKNATTIKPNRREATQITKMALDSEEDILVVAEKIMQKTQIDFLTLSLDKDGICYFRDSNNRFQLNEKEVEVFDVTGAGDMVIAMIAVGLTHQIPHPVMIKLANIAASIVISKLGVATLKVQEIIDKIATEYHFAKIKTLDAILEEKAVQDRKQPVIFTNGYFDQFSSEVLKFLFELRNISGTVILAINSDQSIAKQKKKPALLSMQDRIKILSNIESIDFIIVFEDTDASNLIEQIKPDIVVKSKKTKKTEMKELWAIEKINAELKFVDHY